MPAKTVNILENYFMSLMLIEHLHCELVVLLLKRRMNSYKYPSNL